MSSASSTGTPKLPGDRQDGDGGAEIDVQLGPAFGLDGVDEGVDRLLDPVLDPPLRFGRHERWLHQGAVAAVLGTAHHEQAVARTRCRRPTVGRAG